MRLDNGGRMVQKRGRTLDGESINAVRRTVRLNLVDADLKGIELALRQSLRDAREGGRHGEAGVLGREIGESETERRY
jgi:hypothetical protein